jgi:peptidoglycan/LPS O-acetylase OafA/YrhL
MIHSSPTPVVETALAKEGVSVHKRLAFIDGLRGVAMLSVLAYHCWVHTIRAPVPLALGHRHLDLTAPLHLGYLGVNLFLVLSGFCLTYPLARNGTGGMSLDLRRFFRRRVWRILPPYYVALVLFALLPLLERTLPGAADADPLGVIPVTTGQLVSHLLMVHNFSLAWMGAINASFWTLALEWQLYLLFPLFVWGFRRWGAGRTLATVLAITLAYRWWVYVTQDTSRLEVGYIYAYALPGRMFEFVLGMAAAVSVAGLRQPPKAVWIRRYGFSALLLGGLGIYISHRWSPFAPVADVTWGLAFFCLVMYGASRSAHGGGWLDCRPLVSLGLISYSVYLIHEPLITRSYAFLTELGLGRLWMLLLYELVFAPLLIGIGWLFFRAVEAHFLSARPRSPSGQV